MTLWNDEVHDYQDAVCKLREELANKVSFDDTVRRTYNENLVIAMCELDIYDVSLEARHLAKEWTVDDLTQRIYKIMDKQ